MKEIILLTHKGRGIRQIWLKEQRVKQKRRLFNHSQTKEKLPHGKQVYTLLCLYIYLSFHNLVLGSRIVDENVCFLFLFN
jgi:hypothetical protein